MMDDVEGRKGLPTVVAGSGDGGAPLDGSLTGVVARAGVVVTLVTVVVVAAAVAGPWDPAPSAGPTASTPPPVTPAPRITRDPVPDLLDLPPTETWSGASTLWLALGVAAAGGLLYLLVRLLRRWRLAHPGPRREGRPDAAGVGHGDVVGGVPLPDLPAMREGVAGAGEHLRSHLAPGDAVIAAWVALEEAAGRSGVPRHPASTPTEFTLDVLDRTRADRDATRTLLDLYLRARFGHEPLTHDDVAAASAAVGRLAADLAGPPDDEPPAGPADGPPAGTDDEPPAGPPDGPPTGPQEEA